MKITFKNGTSASLTVFDTIVGQTYMSDTGQYYLRVQSEAFVRLGSASSPGDCNIVPFGNLPSTLRFTHIPSTLTLG